MISRKNSLVPIVILLFLGFVWAKTQMEPEKHLGRTLPYTNHVRAPHHSLDVLYTSTDSLPRGIHDLQTTTATIDIPESINIEDIDVGMTIQHTWVRDLTIWLERDSSYLDSVVDHIVFEIDTIIGQDTTFSRDTVWRDIFIDSIASVQLLDLFPGDSIVNMTDFWFDDDAGRGVYEALPPLTGGYRPLRSLDSMFVGHNAQGDWRLKVRDRYLFDEGSLQNFWIEINGVASLSGTVTNTVNSNPIVGASIFVIDTTVIDTTQVDSTGADTVAVGLTLTNGTYSISRIDQGSYRVVAAAANFDTAFADIAIVTGQTTIQDFSLSTNSEFINFTYHGDSIQIPDFGRIEVPLVVSSQGTVQDLDVTINCASTWIGEMVFTLKHPGGDTITLFKTDNPLIDIGDDMINCRFDDEASQSFEAGQPLYG
ncbi:MAG: carboxypeptidase regulatory-like domain-containing protein [bacterium]|nr:carboxypeptidase regulatory-like domain-containing protein [bacterium]